MLHAFILAHRDDVIRRARDRRLASRYLPPSPEELAIGIPLFVDELIAVVGHAGTPGPSSDTMARSAAEEGERMLRGGFTIGQVVHAYGDICQAITQAVAASDATLPAEDYRLLNACLDDAVAVAVTSFEHARESTTRARTTEALGYLAHELRNALTTAVFSADALRTGRVPTTGKVSDVLHASLLRLRDLVDRSLAEVRLENGAPDVHLEPLRLVELVDEVEAAAIGQAETRRQRLQVEIDPTARAMIDRQLYVSALSNIVQNALKYSAEGATIVLRLQARAGKAIVEVTDACGGVPPAVARTMFEPFTRGARDGQGLGLGLSLARRAMDAQRGAVAWRDDAPRGCTFTLSLPALPLTDDVDVLAPAV
jgi:signal transduction histidine kinase